MFLRGSEGETLVNTAHVQRLIFDRENRRARCELADGQWCNVDMDWSEFALLHAVAFVPESSGTKCLLYWANEGREESLHDQVPVIAWALHMIDRPIPLSADGFIPAYCDHWGIIWPDGRVDIRDEICNSVDEAVAMLDAATRR